MKTVLQITVALFGSVCVLPAHAATQGTEGSTSTGTITVSATAPPPPRLVQVLNLADVSLSNSSGTPSYSFTPTLQGSVTIGTSIPFCVVETTGGQVRLVVTSTGGGNNGNGSWKLINSGSGSVHQYKVALTDLNSTGAVNEKSDANGSEFIAFIPASIVRTSAAACSTDNLRLHLGIATLPSTGLTYTDTITLVATPQ